MDEKETNICECCGTEYEITDYNRAAPFAMCDDCYDEFLMNEEMEEG